MGLVGRGSRAALNVRGQNSGRHAGNVCAHMVRAHLLLLAVVGLKSTAVASTQVEANVTQSNVRHEALCIVAEFMGRPGA